MIKPINMNNVNFKGISYSNDSFTNNQMYYSRQIERKLKNVAKNRDFYIEPVGDNDSYEQYVNLYEYDKDDSWLFKSKHYIGSYGEDRKFYLSDIGLYDAEKEKIDNEPRLGDIEIPLPNSLKKFLDSMEKAGKVFLALLTFFIGFTIITDPKTIEYVKQIDFKEITFENILKKADKFASDALRDLVKKLP